MRTVKLVVIGPSGVGKTSLRNQYISGRFTTGYRATIGADFITKTVQHHASPEEKVTLQIWDTAGQERFSSLSSAFFRGADAVILMFDVNQPDTLQSLAKWWQEFKDRAPVPDEEVGRFCCVFVGNKIDVPSANGLARSASHLPQRIGQIQAAQFINNLIPPPPPPPILLDEPSSPAPLTPDQSEVTFNLVTPSPQSHSIDINVYRRHPRQKASISHSRNHSALFQAGTSGTLTSTYSVVSVYHTPTSSIFDHFESARSSPTPHSAFSSRSNLSSPTSSRSPSHSPVRSVRRQPSFSSTLSDAQTITPSLFIQRHPQDEPQTTCTTPSPAHALPVLPTLEQGTKLFFTSAKTGEGVTDVFEYIARRVVIRWEYEETMEARTMHMAEASIDGAIRLQNDARRWNASTCCGS